MKMAITRKFVAIAQFGFFSMAAMAAVVLSSAAVAQQQAPSPEQAPMVLSTLDADGDVKISESEATGGLKQNFAAIDRNGDGGIDLEELTTMLEALTSRRGGGPVGRAPAATSTPASEANGGAAVAQGAPRTELGGRLAEHHGDEAFIRLEDVKLRESVAYSNAAALGALKTPAGAFQAYLSTLAAVEEEAGVKTLLVNSVLQRGRERPNCDWDIVVVKHYPSWRAWEIVESSGLREAAYAHREAAVANDHVVVAVPRIVNAPRQPRPDDPTDTMVYIINHLELREQAQYDDGSYPGSTGIEAYRRYQGGGPLADTSRDLIIIAEVPAVLNAADAHWTSLNIVRYPSLREVVELTRPSDDPESWSMMSKHKEAAIARHCGPMTVPTLPESSVGAVSKTE
jgi:hypothetical protein